MSRTGGAPGHMTGTMTLGDLKGGPASRASCGLPEPSSWFLWTLNISALRALSRILLALASIFRWLSGVGRRRCRCREWDHGRWV